MFTHHPDSPGKRGSHIIPTHLERGGHTSHPHIWREGVTHHTDTPGKGGSHITPRHLERGGLGREGSHTTPTYLERGIIHHTDTHLGLIVSKPGKRHEGRGILQFVISGC